VEFTQTLKRNGTTYQLVPPHTHRRNLAERVIQTYKNHFKAGLATVNPNFPLSEWDRLIPQANITLNLLRASRINPKLSAYTSIFGEFNFAATPLAPPGTKIVAHLKPEQRRTWELNGEAGWYVGPALNHYRCVECYFPRTRTVRICDTVTFFPTTVPFPEVKLEDFLKQVATDIITILASPPSTTTPTLQAGDAVHNALQNIATQLKRIEPMPVLKPQPITPPPRVKAPALQRHLLPPASLPRVGPNKPPPHKPTPTATLLQPSAKLKNSRFMNRTEHRYPLRSQVQRGTNFKHYAAQFLQAQLIFSHTANHIFKPNGSKETIDSVLKSEAGMLWDKSLSNEWGRLAQGNKHGVRSTDTIYFIHIHEL
jgi:hypothetical protein